MRLVTIPISHYCERARWSLDYVGLRYREEQHLQGFHARHARAAGDKTTLPVLFTNSGALTDSADIVRYADTHSVNGQRLYDDRTRDAAMSLERYFADPFGVASRRLIYGATFRWGRGALKYNAANAPRWERWAMHAMYPAIKAFLARYLNVTPDGEEEARGIVDRVLDDVAERLSDGRPYLMGDSFSAADLTFASMSAALICPPQYGVELPQPEDFPDEAARTIQGYRSHPAGAFALQMFARHRFEG